MTNAQTQYLLEKLHLFRSSYHNTGVLLSKLLKDIDAKVLVIPQQLLKEYVAQSRRRFGNHTRKGRLQDELETELCGILTSLKRDFPYFTKEEISIICYSAAGFPDYLIARLSNVCSAKRVSTIRCQLIDLIKNTGLEKRDIYLAMLTTEQKMRKEVSGRNVC
ncbi:MAG: hypothetical protein IK052_04585 [Bacteroidales bacterium]|nr:hypothetical protein [Bacteroidales bacterium]